MYCRHISSKTTFLLLCLYRARPYCWLLACFCCYVADRTLDDRHKAWYVNSWNVNIFWKFGNILNVEIFPFFSGRSNFECYAVYRYNKRLFLIHLSPVTFQFCVCIWITTTKNTPINPQNSVLSLPRIFVIVRSWPEHCLFWESFRSY